MNPEQQRPTYAGAGARQTPAHLAKSFARIAMRLEKLGYILHSGGAAGADTFFELGVRDVQSNARIFLPVPGWRGNTSPRYGVSSEATRIAMEFHPKWSALSPMAKILMARNSYQVLGPNLDRAVEFLICYTLDGQASGGTGQAMRIAEAYDVPIYNLHSSFDAGELEAFLMTCEFNKESGGC